MTTSLESTPLLPDVEFLNHRKVNWQKVKRARYLFYQRFHYAYPGPIKSLRHRLVVVPAARYGDQQLCDHQLRVSPDAVVARSGLDAFGNRVLEFEAPEIRKEVTFETLTEVERVVAKGAPPLMESVNTEHYLEITPLTKPDKKIRETARALQAEASSEHELASAISRWVHGAMCYGFGATGVSTPAAQALKTGKGLCQDYAHIMLALCRAAGLRARYVSGHMLAEGGTHAWVEVLLKGEQGACALAFDPTNNRHPGLNYVTVAVGRDYRDVAPTSGSYQASFSGKLTATKRAGLTAVAYTDGQVIGDTSRFSSSLP